MWPLVSTEGFAAADPSDNLIDLIYSVKSGYRGNAHLGDEPVNTAQIRKIKDADGNYIWQPGSRLARHQR